MKNKTHYECVITIETNPVREAQNKEEFIEKIIDEYNSTCHELFEIDRRDITGVSQS